MWAARLKKSPSWIRTNISILEIFGKITNNDLEANGPSTAGAFEVSTETGSIFATIENDGREKVGVFRPHYLLTRAHYVAAIEATQHPEYARKAIEHAIRQRVAGRKYTARQIRADIGRRLTTGSARWLEPAERAAVSSGEYLCLAVHTETELLIKELQKITDKCEADVILEALRLYREKFPRVAASLPLFDIIDATSSTAS